MSGGEESYFENQDDIDDLISEAWESLSSDEQKDAVQRAVRIVDSFYPWVRVRHEWQPIETAPFERGVFVLGYIPRYKDEHNCPIAVITPEFLMKTYRLEWSFAHDEGGLSTTTEMCEPTHWMPLPEPPND